MKFPYNGKTYEFDLDTLTFDEGEVIEDYARLDVREFLDALKQLKMRAIRAALYISMKRAGEEPRWADLGAVDMLALGQAIVDANKVPTPAEDAEAQERVDRAFDEAAESGGPEMQQVAAAAKLKRSTRKKPTSEPVETATG